MKKHNYTMDEVIAIKRICNDYQFFKDACCFNVSEAISIAVHNLLTKPQTFVVMFDKDDNDLFHGHIMSIFRELEKFKFDAVQRELKTQIDLFNGGRIYFRHNIEHLRGMSAKHLYTDRSFLKLARMHPFYRQTETIGLYFNQYF